MNKKSQKYLVLFLVIMLAGLSIYFIGDYAGLWAAAPDEEVTPTTKLTSTFTLIDYVTGEDVSEWVEITVWEPTSAADFDDEEDPYRLINFERMETTKDASDVAVDFRDGEYYWVEIDPDDDVVYGGYDLFAASGFPSRYGATTDDYRFIIGGANYDYLMYVYHLPYNTTINVLDRSCSATGHDGATGLDEWVIGTSVDGGVDHVGTENGTFTVYLDIPNNATDGLHAGSVVGHDWDMDTDITDLFEWEDLRWLRDQRNFRVQAPFYDPADDTDREYDDDLEVLTNAFCVRFTFNVTVNGNASTHVTFELIERNYESYPIEVVIHGTFIDCIFYEPITWTDGMFPSFDFNITCEESSGPANGIGITEVATGRLTVPGDQGAIGVFTRLADAPLPAA